jgi:tetratricopeptide (TPR) repeat protein
MTRINLPRIYTYLAQSHEFFLDIPAAEHYYRLALDMACSQKGEDHEDVLQIKYRMGTFLVLASRPQEGLKLCQEAVEMALRTKGQDDLFHTQAVRVGYGGSLLRYGRVEEGLVLIYEAVEVRRRGKRARTSDFADNLVKLADGETELGHYSQAAALLEESFKIHAATGGTPASGRLGEALLARVRVLIATKQVKEAELALRSLSAEADPGRPPFHSLDVSIERAAVDLAKGQNEDAVRDAREIRTRLESGTQRRHLKHFEAQADLDEGKGLLLTGHANEAFPLLERAVQLASEVYDPERSALADAQVALARCELKLGRRGQALGLFAQAKAIHSSHKELGEQHQRPLRELAAELGVH